MFRSSDGKSLVHQKDGWRWTFTPRTRSVDAAQRARPQSHRARCVGVDGRNSSQIKVGTPLHQWGGTDDVWFYDMQADGWSLDDKRNALLSEAQQAELNRRLLGEDGLDYIVMNDADLTCVIEAAS